jgi:uncharacterized repeat protein (TIGR03803 family)
MRRVAAGLLFIACVSVAACGQGTTPNVAPSLSGAGSFDRRGARAATYQRLFDFAGKNGAAPSARLIDDNGSLYGTTAAGGSHGDGVVFNLTTSGKERVLHDFTGSEDGANPYASLTSDEGSLYGTTAMGGAYCRRSNPVSCGTVFSVTMSGKERVLHSFGSGSDGANPYAALVSLNGTLYGTTLNGGAYGLGTLFSISTAGEEHLLYSFKGGTDGAYPGTLIAVKGSLYGTTEAGGTGCNTSSFPYGPGCGTVYALRPSSTERLIYRFKDRKDGVYPVGITEMGGMLYGTTVVGGEGACFVISVTLGCGTVFEITPSGGHRIITSFQGKSGGDFPLAGVIDVKGTLYGTTWIGGDSTCHMPSESGCGQVFALSTAGKFKVLHQFAGKPDGAYPEAPLLERNGTLYGTTTAGGQNGSGFGDGTIFALTP